MIIGEPSVACSDSNTFYYTALWADGLNDVSGVVLGKSTNGGNFFSVPAAVVAKDASTHLVDHDWLVIDPSNPNHLFVVYADIDFSGILCGIDSSSGSVIPRYAIEMVSSSDGGVSWSAASTVVEQVCADASSPNASVSDPQVAIGPQSQVYVTWEAAGENGAAITARDLKIAKSIDGGESFAAPIVVAPVSPVGNGADLQGFVRSNEFPSLAIGKGEKDSGFLYLAWNDSGSNSPDLLSSTGLYGFANIKFAVSSNGGATWSVPVRVNSNTEGSGKPFTDQFEPTIAADKTGRLAVCFYDRQWDPNNFLIDRVCASSTNYGASWHNSRITRAGFPSVVGQDIFVAPDYMGDYEAVVSDITNQSVGFIDSYASNAAGNPNVMINKY